jgi:conjugal transfer pilus assembly protein TraV
MATQKSLTNGLRNRKEFKMNKAILLVVVQCAILAGCMSPIGKPEFSCPNQKKGGACAGPRDIHALTNTRDNLHNLKNEPGFEQYAVPTDEDTENKGVIFGSSNKESKPTQTAAVPGNLASPEAVFTPRDHTQQSAGNYQPVVALPQIRTEHPMSNNFDAWPTTTEPLAPEPLAVLTPAKVMRVLIASYKDGLGNLNMPGFVYVQVEPETWSFGEAANLRPQRVVPLQVIERANQETNARQNRERGVSSIEVLPGNRN